MKRYWYTLTLLILAALLASCTGPFSESAPDGVSGEAMPGDTVSDTVRRGGSFTFETVFSVALNVKVDLYRLNQWGLVTGDPRPADETDVFVFVDDTSGNRIFTGKLSDTGVLAASVMLPAAPEDMILTIAADGYGERSVTIPDMVELSSVNRTMAMGRFVASDEPFLARQLTGLEDRDGDGVPDAYDAFPDNPNAAFEVNVPAEGQLSIAFEDLFGRANAGDADYNDFVGAYSITEVLNDAGQVVSITVNADAVTKLAGYNHRFGIRIDSFQDEATLSGTMIDRWGREAPLSGSVESPAEIVLFDNSRYAVGKSATFTLEFDTPQIRDLTATDEPVPGVPIELLSEPPYNPYAYIYNTGHDVHLIGREPLTNSINPGDLFVDGDGFPWALLVPGDWINPEEGQRIETPYPRFTLWRESGGEEHSDWYLHYYDPYVPPVDQSDVYVAGYVNSGGTDVATIWVDDGDTISSTSLPAAGDAEATDLYVGATGATLASGYYNNGLADVVVYWADTSITELEDNGRATGITVDDAGVAYVSGFYQLDGITIAAYWTDDAGAISRIDLDTSSNSRATGIAVASNGDVYVSGYSNNGSYDVATLWIDSGGVVTSESLFTGALSQANAVDIDGADAFVAGRYISGGVNASYWVNDEPGLVTLSGTSGNATDVDHDGSVTRVAGDYLIGGIRQAAVWTNGVAVDLDTAAADVGGFANGIFVLADDVYVAGFQQQGGFGAVYWTNGSLVDLSGGDVSKANAIFVVE